MAKLSKTQREHIENARMRLGIVNLAVQELRNQYGEGYMADYQDNLLKNLQYICEEINAVQFEADRAKVVKLRNKIMFG